MPPLPRPLAIPLGIVLLLFLPPAIAAGAGRDEIVREDIASYGDYRFVMEQRVVHYDDEPNELLKTAKMEAFLIVYKGAQEIYRSDEGYQWRHDRYLPKIGTDVTGDGSPDVVLINWSGGAHCCDTYYIIELREPLNVITLYTGDGGASFEDLDDLPGLELVVSDENFKYWINSFCRQSLPPCCAPLHRWWVQT